MVESGEVLRQFQDKVGPYTKPQDEVAYIRRILALYLESSSQDGLIRRPLSLADGATQGIDTEIACGAYKEYLEALKLNTEARQKFQDACSTLVSNRGPTLQKDDSPNYLEERLALLSLQKKRRRLHTIRDYLDEHEEDPVAAVGYLDQSQMLAGIEPQPEVPKEIVNSLIAAQSSAEPDLKIHAAKLEKVVLRAKITLRHEERLLQKAKKDAEGLPHVISTAARTRALDVTRNELINWIEIELSNAAGEEHGPDNDNGGGGEKQEREQVDQADVDAKLARIREQYAEYLSYRQTLLGNLAREPNIDAAPVLRPQDTDEQSSQSTQPPRSHLTTPYIERLLALSRKQKAMIAQKSLISATLSSHTKEACQNLGHLAEESQLLPAYPMKDSLRRRSGLQDELTGRGSGRPDMARRIKPWVFAADSAKIASLEAVAESVERGQISLEATTRTLDEMNDLVGGAKKQRDDPASDGMDDTQDDVWMAGEQRAEKARKHTSKAPSVVPKPGDPWSLLHGGLGLLGQEDMP